MLGCQKDVWRTPPSLSGRSCGATPRRCADSAAEPAPLRAPIGVPRTAHAIPRRTYPEILSRALSPVGRSEEKLASSGCDPGSGRRQEPHNARADDGTHAHNTPSADIQDVQVFYPFHPLHGAWLHVLRRPKRGDGAVCVVDPVGRRLKIPVWMLSPDCAEIKITEQRPHLNKGALLSLASLIAPQLDSKGPVHDNLLQTVVDQRKGGRRSATTTSGPGDSKGMQGRANGRSDARRSNRSHGSRSDSGLSQGGRKSR